MADDMTTLDYQVEGDAMDVWVACPHPRCHWSFTFRAWPVTLGQLSDAVVHHEADRHAGDLAPVRATGGVPLRA